MSDKTTIGVSRKLTQFLTTKKTHPKESYEEVITRLLGGLQ
jgi:hypothetical protein